MNIDKLIERLEVLKQAHGGDVEVNVWAYAGGNDELCDVTPGFDPELKRVVLERSFVKPAIIS